MVQMIINGEIEVDDRAMFLLPEDSKSLSDTGEGCIVDYGYNEYGVYFFSFRGTLGSSKGFLYMLTDEEYANINISTNRFNFVSMEKISDRWYKVSTDD